jgi:hypothetical protein
VALTGASFAFKEENECSMRSRRPDYQSDDIQGEKVAKFMQMINCLPTYNLSGKHLARVRAIPVDIKNLRWP